MQKRELGNSGLEVSALGLGCMRMSFNDKPVDKQEMISLLKSAVGVVYLDIPHHGKQYLQLSVIIDVRNCR